MVQLMPAINIKAKCLLSELRNSFHMHEYETHFHLSSIFVPWLSVRDLTRQDLELVVERRPVAPNPRGLLDGVWPLAYGLLLGFSVASLVSGATLLLIVNICNSDRQQSTNSSRRRRSARCLRGHCDRDLLTGVVTSSELTSQEVTETPLVLTSL